MKSESIAALAKALSNAQSQFKHAPKNSKNPFFKSEYADLASIWDTCKLALTSNGLAVIQTTDQYPSGGVVLNTMLVHSSGEWISGAYPVNPVKQDPQSLGSAITYARRYALQAILGIATENEDDDAETATRTAHEPAAVKGFIKGLNNETEDDL